MLVRSMLVSENYTASFSLLLLFRCFLLVEWLLTIVCKSVEFPSLFANIWSTVLIALITSYPARSNFGRKKNKPGGFANGKMFLQHVQSKEAAIFWAHTEEKRLGQNWKGQSNKEWRLEKDREDGDQQDEGWMTWRTEQDCRCQQK